MCTVGCPLSPVNPSFPENRLDEQKKRCYYCYVSAGVAELADALDLGSSGLTVRVQIPSPAPRAILFVRHAWLLSNSRGCL
jgi:hypothetical protein